jgi:hypothetical protein
MIKLHSTYRIWSDDGNWKLSTVVRLHWARMLQTTYRVKSITSSLKGHVPSPYTWLRLVYWEKLASLTVLWSRYLHTSNTL